MDRIVPDNLPDPLLAGPGFPDLKLVMRNGKQTIESRTNFNLRLDETCFNAGGTYTMARFFYDLNYLCGCHLDEDWCPLVFEDFEAYDDFYGNYTGWTPRMKLAPGRCSSAEEAMKLCQTVDQRMFFLRWLDTWDRMPNPSTVDEAWGPGDEPSNDEELNRRLGFPALIPEVWLNYFGRQKDESDELQLSENPSRVDFVMFNRGKKCVIEIDGPSHYATFDEFNRRYDVSEERYTKNLKIERSLRSQGWQIFRFSRLEVRETDNFYALTADIASPAAVALN